MQLHFGGEGGHASLNEGLQIGLVELELVGDALEMLDGDPGRHFVTLGDPDGVNSPLEEALGLLEKRAGHDDDAGGSVADFVVLTPRELHHQLRDLVVHVHLVKDRGTVVRCKNKNKSEVRTELNALASEGFGSYLLIVTSPSGLWSILSMPLGPREVRRMRATALPAEMLAF